MPIKGDVKREFAAMQEAVKDSINSTIKLCVERGLRFAREDHMIDGDTTLAIPTKKGFYHVYLSTAEMNMYANARRGRIGRKVFHNRKFVVRTGNLRDSFTPVLPWSGNRLSTMGEGSVEVVTNGKENYAAIKFTGNAERTLSHGDSRRKVEITDKNGNPKNSRTSRKPMDGFKKTVKLFNDNLKSQLDKKARAMR